MKQAKEKRKTKKILIVDDHPLVRSGIALLIRDEPEWEVCGECEDAEAALEAVEKLEPDIVLVDISLKQGNGLGLMRDVKQRFPNVLMLAISMHEEATYAKRSLKAGARGYIMKQEGMDSIREAIRTVLDGKIHVSTAVAQSIMSGLSENEPISESPADRLSNRELEVFELTGQGLEIQEIAKRMTISPRTVEAHRFHIKQKLGLRTGTDIFQQAYEWLRSNRV